MIPDVRPRFARLRLPRQALILAVATACLAAGHGAGAHEAERTRVSIVFSTDGRFVVEVANDPAWLLLRLETFAESGATDTLPPAERDARLAQLAPVFADRIVLFVDGHEVRAESTVYIPAPPHTDPNTLPPLATFRLRGTMPAGAASLRWLYGMVADPYPLEIRQADGSSTIEWIQGTNWSGIVDLTRSFPRLTRTAIARQYVVLGYTHILPKGLDHILFVLGLFLLSARARPLLLQVTAFTIAHSITLGLSIYGLVSLSPRLVEPLIALSIVYVAIENLITRELKPWRIALVFMFGLLHGLGFAGVLSELGLPRDQFLTGLLTFNVGVEGGQLTVIAVAALIAAPLTSRRWYRQRVVIPASLAIAAVGVYWTVTRITQAL